MAPEIHPVPAGERDERADAQYVEHVRAGGSDDIDDGVGQIVAGFLYEDKHKNQREKLESDVANGDVLILLDGAVEPLGAEIVEPEHHAGDEHEGKLFTCARYAQYEADVRQVDGRGAAQQDEEQLLHYCAELLLVVANLGAFTRAIHIEAKLRYQREVPHEGEGPRDDAVVCRAQHTGYIGDGDEGEDESGGCQDDRFARLLGHESSRLYLIMPFDGFLVSPQGSSRR